LSEMKKWILLFNIFINNIIENILLNISIKFFKLLINN
jgi:hypothetical protein